MGRQDARPGGPQEIALVLVWLLADVQAAHSALPAVAFLPGILPEGAIRYLRERSRFAARSNSGQADALKLKRIEGINTDRHPKRSYGAKVLKD